MSMLYVATNGSDTAAGTLAAPLATLAKAVERAMAGDTIVMRGGSYTIKQSVKIEKPNITVQSYENEVAKLAGSNTNTGLEVIIRIDIDAHNTKLVNLDISGGYYYTVKSESSVDWGIANEHGPSYLTISGCKLHDSGADVIKLTPKTDYSIIENCEIYNSGRTNPDNAEGIDAVQANYAICRNNYIHDITTNGIYYKGGSLKTLIEGNRVTRTGHSGILLGQHSDEIWFDLKVNPKYYESVDGIVRNNVVWDTEGCGVGSWAALRPQIYNNTLVNVAKSIFCGLLVQGQELYIPNLTMIPSTDVTMHHNIVVVNSDRPVFEVRERGLTGFLKTDNNLFYQGGKAPQFWDTDKDYYGDITGWRAMGRDVNSTTADPKLDAAFKLTTASPVKDVGANVTGTTPTPEPEPDPQPEPEPDPQPDPEPTPEPTPTWTNTTFAKQTGKFELTFNLKPAATNMDMVFGLSNGAAATFTSLGPIVRLNTSGKFDARNGGSYAAVNGLSYQQDKDYQVRMVVDVAKRTYDAYITPTGSAAVQIASGYGFRTEMASVTALDNFATRNEAGDAVVSNVKATTVVVPAPVNGYLNVTVPVQTNKFTMQITASAAQVNRNVSFGLSNGPADQVTDLTVGIRFNLSGTIDVRSGGAWLKSAAFKYSKDTSYTFKVDVDLTARVYSVLVNAPGGTPVQVAQKLALGNTQKSVNNLARVTASGGVMTLGTPTFGGTTTEPTTPTEPTPVPSTTDLARGKTTVASSMESPDLGAQYATDGTRKTRWGSGPANTAWLKVDLGATYPLAKVNVDWEWSSAAAYEVQVSNDGTNWTTVASHTNAPQGGVVTSTFDAAGRYVRVNCLKPRTTFGFSIWSLEVYGK